MDAPAVVAGVAVLKVMFPVWFRSPMVIVPVEVVKMRPSSAEVRLMPAPELLLLPPINIGRDSTEDWMVTELVATGAAVISLTVELAPLAMYRLPCRSNVSAMGELRPEVM